MLRQKNRFHGHGSLRYVYSKGSVVRSSQITIKYITNPKRKNNRYAVVISKKVIKSAVKRNKIRRRVYEIIRLELPYLKDNFDVVLTVFSPEVLIMPHVNLKRLIKQVLSSAELYK